MLRVDGRLCGLALALLLALPLGAVQPGEVVKGVAGLAVAARPGGAAQTVLRGSPALVLAVQKDSRGKEWVRLLAADGGSGWTSQALGAPAPARIAGGRTLELSDRSPDQPSVAEGIETLEVPREGAVIAGASEKSRVASLDQLMLPPRLNPFLTPWLEIRSGDRKGWIVPSELALEWGEAGATMDGLGMDGIVRAPFLGPAQRLLPDPPAPRLEFDDILSKPARAAAPKTTWQTPQALVRVAGVQATAYSGKKGLLLSFSMGGGAVIDQGNPVISRAAAGDLDGDGKQELVLQLAARYGDGYTTALWIVNGAAKEPGIRVVPLGGSSGEPGGSSVEGCWWMDGTVLWIARAEAGRVEYARVGDADERAYAVVGGPYTSRDAAERRAIALSNPRTPAVQVFPVAGPGKSPRWAAGRIFRLRAAAEAWRKAAAPAAGLRVIRAPAEKN